MLTLSISGRLRERNDVLDFAVSIGYLIIEDKLPKTSKTVNGTYLFKAATKVSKDEEEIANYVFKKEVELE